MLDCPVQKVSVDLFQDVFDYLVQKLFIDILYSYTVQKISVDFFRVCLITMYRMYLWTYFRMCLIFLYSKYLFIYFRMCSIFQYRKCP